ncbi:hypothetical protein GGR55DRAFT_617983 [Xylaria sp. FL0064]|nr:hypothetical protein GGR55DRAFT_617983 [Xylaria sp. FL0064]
MRPKYSHPLCTALQIALVKLLSSFGVFQRRCFGHSSDEIAAADANGSLALVSACKVVYICGCVAGKLKNIAVFRRPRSHYICRYTYKRSFQLF